MTFSIPGTFKSAGHFIATALSDLRVATKYLEKNAPTIEKDIKEVESATAVAAVFFPQANSALVIERGIDAAAGEFFALIHSINVAEDAKTVDVTLDVAVINQYKQFFADQKSNFSNLGYTFSKPTA